MPENESCDLVRSGVGFEDVEAAAGPSDGVGGGRGVDFGSDMVVEFKRVMNRRDDVNGLQSYVRHNLRACRYLKLRNIEVCLNQLPWSR